MKLRIKSLSKESLYFYKDFIISTLNKLSVSYSVSYLPTRKKRITLLKSPHVNKKSKEQFQFTSYKLFISLNVVLNVKELKFLIMNKPKTVKVTLSRF
jgi:small subunit ribosomal protein S10